MLLRYHVAYKSVAYKKSVYANNRSNVKINIQKPSDQNTIVRSVPKTSCRYHVAKIERHFPDVPMLSDFPDFFLMTCVKSKACVL